MPSEQKLPVMYVVKVRYAFFPMAVYKTPSDPQRSLQTHYSHVTIFQMDQPDFVKRLFTVTPGESNYGMAVLSQNVSVHDKLIGHS
jgi:hypothetical protein